MMREVLFLSLLVGLPGAAPAADLLDVYALAVESDPRLRAAHHARDAVHENRPLARSALLPQLDASAAYGTERTEITAVDEAGRSNTRTDTSEPYDYGLDLTQLVFDFGAISRLRQAGDEAAAADAELLAEVQTLVFRTAESYFDVLAAADDLRLARAENDAVSRQREQADARFRAGIAAYTDVQEAQAQYDLTRATILETERVLRDRRQGLAEITGRAGFALSALREEIPLRTPAPDDPDAWVDAALEHNPELVSARFRTRAAAREIDRSRAGYFPALRLEAEQRFGETAGFNRGEFDTRGVGLVVDLPIFRGFATRASVRRAQSLFGQSQAELEALRRAVERLTRDAFFGVASGSAEVRALRQAVASNRTALEASEAGLRAGTRTLVDVLNAQRLLFQAERDYARARYEYLLSVLRLKAAAGRLAPNDLAEINSLVGPGTT